MKQFILSCFLFSLCANAQLNVTYNLANFSSQPQAIKQVKMFPLVAVGTNGSGSILVPIPMTQLTSFSGSLTYSNIVPGYSYRVWLLGDEDRPVATFTNYFPPNLSGTVNAANYLGFTNAPAFGFYFPVGLYTNVVAGSNVFLTTDGLDDLIVNTPGTSINGLNGAVSFVITNTAGTGFASILVTNGNYLVISNTFSLPSSVVTNGGVQTVTELGWWQLAGGLMAYDENHTLAILTDPYSSYGGRRLYNTNPTATLDWESNQLIGSWNVTTNLSVQAVVSSRTNYSSYAIVTNILTVNTLNTTALNTQSISDSGSVNAAGLVTSGAVNVGGIQDNGTLAVGGSSSLDSGQITSDGSGDFTATSLTSTSSLLVYGTSSLDNGAVATDGSGDLTIDGSFSLYGDLNVNGSSSFDAGNWDTDGFGNVNDSHGVGDLSFVQRQLYDSSGSLSVDWNARQLTGNWTGTGSVSGLALLGSNGASVWLKANPVFASSSNIAQFLSIPTVTSNFATANFDNTGGLSGEFEGYTFDGTNHYVSVHAGQLGRFTNDAAWTGRTGATLIASNMNALSGLTGVNHIGGIKYFDGMIWATVETYNGVGEYSGQQIVRYNASNLGFIDTHSIASGGQEAADLCIIPDAGLNGLIVVCSYDVPPALEVSRLACFDLSNFAFLGYLNMSAPISYMQGIDYNSYDGRLYIDGNGIDWGGDIHCVGLNGTNYGDLWNLPNATGPGQSITIVSNTIRLLYDYNNTADGQIVYLGLSNAGTLAVASTGAVTIGNTATITGAVTAGSLTTSGNGSAVSGHLSLGTNTDIGYEAFNLNSLSAAPVSIVTNSWGKMDFVFPGQANRGRIWQDQTTGGYANNVIYNGGWSLENTNYAGWCLMGHMDTGLLQFRMSSAIWGGAPAQYIPLVLESASMAEASPNIPAADWDTHINFLRVTQDGVQSGSVNLVAGAATVTTAAVTSGDNILLTCGPGGVVPSLAYSNVISGTSFQIVASSATATNKVNWWIIKQ